MVIAFSIFIHHVKQGPLRVLNCDDGKSLDFLRPDYGGSAHLVWMFFFCILVHAVATHVVSACMGMCTYVHIRHMPIGDSRHLFHSHDIGPWTHTFGPQQHHTHLDYRSAFFIHHAVHIIYHGS